MFFLQSKVAHRICTTTDIVVVSSWCIRICHTVRCWIIVNQMNYSVCWSKMTLGWKDATYRGQFYRSNMVLDINSWRRHWPKFLLRKAMEFPHILWEENFGEIDASHSALRGKWKFPFPCNFQRKLCVFLQFLCRNCLEISVFFQQNFSIRYLFLPVFCHPFMDFKLDILEYLHFAYLIIHKIILNAYFKYSVNKFDFTL